MFKSILKSISQLQRNKVVRNVVLVGGITLFIKGIAFYKETLVAAHFGLSMILDTFFIAFLIPGFIQNVFIESFKSVFIPNYVAELHRGKNMASFQATGFLTTFLISVSFAIIALLFTDVYLEIFFSGHDPEYYKLIKSQFYFLLPCIIIWGFTSLLSGLLNINEEFKLSSLNGVFFPITTIICLLFFRETFGDQVLAISALIGTSIGFLYLLVVCIKKDILHVAWPDFNNLNIRIMFKQIPAKLASSIFSGSHTIIEQYFAAQLIIGSIAAINYAQKIPAFAIGILVIAMNTVLLPHFSKLVITDSRKAFSELFKMLKVVFLGSAIVAILGIFTSDFFVSFFFERKEFTSEDSKLVAALQQIILIYIPFKISGMLLVNFLTSINKNNYMAIVSFVSLILNILLNFILMKYYGIFGIAISTTVVVIIRNIILFIFTLKQKGISLNS